MSRAAPRANDNTGVITRRAIDIIAGAIESVPDHAAKVALARELSAYSIGAMIALEGQEVAAATAERYAAAARQTSLVRDVGAELVTTGRA